MSPCAGPRTAVANPVEVTASTRVSEEYNDNVSFQKGGPDDFGTLVGAGLWVDYRTPRTALSVYGRNTAVFFTRERGLRNAARAQNGGLELLHAWSPRLSIHMVDFMTRFDETRSSAVNSDESTPPAPENTPPSSAGSTAILRQGESLSNSAGLDLSYRLRPQWTAVTRYWNHLENFSEPSSRDLINTCSVRLRHDWSPTLSLEHGYEYTRFDFRHNGADVETHTPFTGIKARLTPKWTAEGSIGPSLTRRLGKHTGGALGNTEPTYRLTLARMDQRSVVLISGSRQITASAGIAGASLTHGASLFYDRRLLEHLSASLHAAWVDFNTDAADFSALTTGAAVEWEITKYLSAVLDYSYRRRESDRGVSNRLEAGTVDGNIISVSVRFAPPIWRGYL
jgi:hypothetical protein